MLHDPEMTKRVGCESCGTLLDPTSDHVRALETENRSRRKPSIPLGSEGSLFGHSVRILGFMERSVWYAGMRYPWREYLLKGADGSYRWLVESDGHWIFVEPLAPGAHSTILRRRIGCRLRRTPR